ncbi:General transcription factor II-I repeat domain-containing protein 2 [Merluccius polli]|uniref:General transcription factor II-I repeat domain-containing protein 2 n=1 Tax=Merluccius polli TaxID=89951 RepID=A0AA47NVL8_MERPO|nr:General transcription factor II-I repeat domain-containing protein 2 [Merluccius polli]
MQIAACAHSLKINNVMKTVVSTINFIKSRELNNRQFKELLSELDLVYHCEVRWSRANMPARFYALREVRHFMEMKGKTVVELSDGKFLSDLAFMLNIKLQGPNRLVNSLLSNVKSFEVKLRLWQGQLERGNTVLLRPNMLAFDERFHGVKNIQKELDMFATPFNVQPSDVPDNLQMEIIEVQNNNEFKAKYNNLSLLDLYHPEETCPEVCIPICTIGTTFCCEQFFSKPTLAKTRFRSRLTDPNLDNRL